MNENNYQAPESELIEEDQFNQQQILASRWSRLGASIIDGIVIFLVLFPVMFLFGWFDMIAQPEEGSFVFDLLAGLAGILVFLVVNYRMLVSNGQTVGKRLLGIKIVSIDGGHAELNDHLIKRYATYFLPSQIPIIGAFFSLVNVLFIFGQEKRCIHDLAGKTKVIIA